MFNNFMTYEELWAERAKHNWLPPRPPVKRNPVSGGKRMSDMVERVALAIAKERVERWDATIGTKLDVRLARAAIEAYEAYQDAKRRAVEEYIQALFSNPPPPNEKLRAMYAALKDHPHE